MPERGTEVAEWDQALILNALRRMRYAADALGTQAASIATAGRAVADCLRSGGTVLVCGNGGSAAAAQHFAAEFTGKLALDRRPMPAIALNVDTSAMTAIANDYSYDEIFARQVTAFAGGRAVLVGLSTSGTSKNVVRAIDAAKAHGVTTIGLTGAVNRLGADLAIEVPLRETARVQEVHDLVLHEIAQIAERLVIPELDDDSSADRYPFVLDPEQARAFADWMRRSGQTLVTTNGIFDLLHEGHISSLRTAREFGDRLVVIVNSDESTRRLKGESRPIRALECRIADLSAVAAVDHVIVMSGDDPAAELEVLRPSVHAKGEEYRERVMPEAAVVEAGGGRIEFVALRPGISTSATIAKIQS